MSAEGQFGRYKATTEQKRSNGVYGIFTRGERALIPGHQWKFKFANGYGASVIDDGYGSPAQPYELAVLGPDGSLCYDTPITDDVLGWLTAEEVAETLAKIEALP